MDRQRGQHLPQGRGVGVSEAAKNAETLFETQSIVEIREVETKTRTEIEGKKQQLRLLVGDAYRDLISSADKILEMTHCCDRVVENTTQMQGGFANLANSIMASRNSKDHRTDKSKQREELYAIGSRIKYLVDTPEMIWGCLDTKDYLEASHRFLRASEVHRMLFGAAGLDIHKRFPLLRHQWPLVQKFRWVGEPPCCLLDVHKRFPLLRHQWPLVQKFRGQIIDRVTQRLRTETQLSAADAAGALAAAAYLESLESTQVLDMFLSARRAWALGHLQAAQGAATDLAATLCQLASEVQEGVCQAGELFLPPPIQTTQPLLPAKAATDGVSSSELLFGPLPGAEQGATEAEAWQVLSSGIAKKLPALQQEQVATACLAWLAQVASDFQQAGLQLLASCASAADLAGLEAALKASIARWQHVVPAPPDSNDVLSAARTPSAQQSPRFDPAFEDSDHSGGVPTGWEGVCDWVLSKRVSIWDELFEAAFLQRGKELIEQSFLSISDGMRAPLDACLEDALNAPAEPAGSYQPACWPEVAFTAADTVIAGSADARKRARLAESDRPGKPRPAAAGQAGSQGQHWRVRVEELRADFDAQLRGALKDALLLLHGDPAQDASQRSADRQRSGSTPHRISFSSSSKRHASSRSPGLETYIQEKCAQAAQAVAQLLDERLAALTQPAADDAGAAVVEQALLIGRLASGLAGQQTFLRVVLGSPDHWQDPQQASASPLSSSDALRRSASGTRMHGRNAAPGPLESLQASFRRVSLLAYRLWAKWAAAVLAGQLQEALSNDATLSATTALRTWEETVITQEDELGGPAVEMRFSLPATPSPPALVFLLSACREVQRAGGHQVGVAAVEALEWELGGAALQAVRTLLKTGSVLDRKVSEKGVLQLLFDLRFLQDALAGGRPSPSGGSAAPAARGGRPNKGQNAEVGERRRSFADMESGLQERLDPIDWATYEPYLWANEAQCYQRAGVLFGALMHLNRMHSEASIKSATSTEANLMSVAPTAARFAYLPISTPSLAAAGLRRLPSASPGGSSRGGGEEAQSGGDYSFAAAFGGSKAINSAALEQQRAADSPASSSTFENLQSKFTSQRLGAFGSLLGDKAAEVTAMAQQSFGDMLQPAFPLSSASGLLSTFRGFKGTTE
ncbi:hypothetical protein WJX72_006789 [[Myrmecia] bisecta]|uniref:Conserved oligomeric Golgi complex subunit 1 n=1 Tax=[Myrmecia] bisecta TaxID=41462 RepID=A0AAW1PBH2_9CHLO